MHIPAFQSFSARISNASRVSASLAQQTGIILTSFSDRSCVPPAIAMNIILHLSIAISLCKFSVLRCSTVLTRYECNSRPSRMGATRCQVHPQTSSPPDLSLNHHICLHIRRSMERRRLMLTARSRHLFSTPSRRIKSRLRPNYGLYASSNRTPR